MKKVLGVDPGSRITGFGVIEEKNGRLIPVHWGVIKADTQKNFGIRLKQIYQGIDSVIEKYQPTETAFESLFFAKNVNSAIKLGQARGAAMTAAANHNLKIFEYSPTQVKQAVATYGRSSKEQIQKMVYMLLGIREFQNEKIMMDATDALAVAICHIHSDHLKLNTLWKGSRDDRAITR